jgi:hypothetical protein
VKQIDSIRSIFSLFLIHILHFIDKPSCQLLSRKRLKLLVSEKTKSALNLTTRPDPCQLTICFKLYVSLVLKDPYRRQGTAYLHIRDDRGPDEARLENPTGAVVVPISLATTFEQKTPGLATASGDPNSFGKGYEYSRTGKKLLYRQPLSTTSLHIYLSSILPDFCRPLR